MDFVIVHENKELCSSEKKENIKMVYKKLVERVNKESEELKTNEEIDAYESLRLNYELNYNVKELKKIAKYYKINIRKQRKENIVEMLTLFETNPENVDIVEHRKLMWFYFESLLEDPFFSSYMIVD